MQINKNYIDWRCTTFILKPSHRCNLNCSYCYDRWERSKHNEIMPVDDLIFALKKVIDECPGPVDFIWHGGEPTLLGIDYITKVMDAVHVPNKTSWQMQTNGVLLDEAFIDLANRYTMGIGVSWDGPTQVRTRKYPLDINRLRELGQKADCGIGLLMVVTPENADTLIEAWLTANDNGFTIMFNQIFGEGNSLEEYYKIADGLLDLFYFLTQQEDAKILRPFDSIYTFFLGDSKGSLCEQCFCPLRWFGIDFNGNVLPCGKPWAEKIVYGNIFDKDFHLKDAEKSYGCQQFIEGKEKNLQHCKNCKYLTICQNGCPHENFATGTYEFSEIKCKYFQRLADGIYNILDEGFRNHTIKNKEILETLNRSSLGAVKQ